MLHLYDSEEMQNVFLRYMDGHLPCCKVPESVAVLDMCCIAYYKRVTSPWAMCRRKVLLMTMMISHSEVLT